MFALGEPAGGTRRSAPLRPSTEEIEQILHARLRVLAMGETLDSSPAVKALIEDGIPQLALLASGKTTARGGCQNTDNGAPLGERTLTRFFEDAPREIRW